MRVRVAAAALVLVLASVPCAACDSVTLEFEPGYPPPGPVSVEHSSVSVSRCSMGAGQQTGSVDVYFEAVRRALTVAKLEADWGVPAIDAPFVRVSIEMDGRKLRLIATSYNDGLKFSLYPTEQDLANRVAMKAIVRLTLQHAGSRFGFAPGE